jgi:hypothetical protein
MRLTNDSNRKALKSLQNVAGLCGLVVACEEVQFAGAVVGHFTGGEPLRAVLPVMGYIHGISLTADLRCTYGSIQWSLVCTGLMA